MSASNIRFNYNNLVDTASLTASDEVATLPIENIQDSRLDCKFRSTTDDITIDFDLGSAQAVNSLVVLNHNISSAVTVLKWQNKALVGDSYADYVDLLDPQGGDGAYNAYDDKIIIWYPDSVSKRYWRLVITDASNPDGYIEIGRVFMGTYFEPAHGVKQGTSIGKKDLSEINKNMQGTPYANTKDKIWTYTFGIANYPSDPAGTDDLQSFINMFDDIGNGKEVIISLDPDRGSGTNRYSNLKRFSAYGILTGDFNATDVASIKFSSSFSFEETV